MERDKHRGHEEGQKEWEGQPAGSYEEESVRAQSEESEWALAYTRVYRNSEVVSNHAIGDPFLRNNLF